MKNRKCPSWVSAPLMVIGFLLIVAGLSAAVMLLWNAILPDLTGVSSISFWQALGLLVLSKILFGGFSGGCHNKKKNGPPHRFRKKWRNMDEEERQKFKEEWKKRCR